MNLIFVRGLEIYLVFSVRAENDLVLVSGWKLTVLGDRSSLALCVRAETNLVLMCGAKRCAVHR